MMEQVRTTTTPVAEHEGVLQRLYEVEYIGMVRLAYTLVGNNADAEDLVQDSFVEVSRRLDDSTRSASPAPTYEAQS
jgi:DNA-directed RNA polymerase specialized sigma24 family protein